MDTFLSALANFAQFLGVRDARSWLAIGVLTTGFQSVRALWTWKQWTGPNLTQEWSLLIWADLKLKN